MRGLGQRLRAARKARGLTMVALADAAEVSQPFLSKVEREATNPSLHTLYRLAHALDIPVSDLLPSEELAQATVVRASEGAIVATTEDPASPPIRLVSLGGTSRMQVLDYRADASRNVGDWFDVVGEGALVIVSGSLVVDVEGIGRWTLAAHDTLFLRGPTRTRWTAPGPDPCSLLLFSVE